MTSPHASRGENEIHSVWIAQPQHSQRERAIEGISWRENVNREGNICDHNGILEKYDRIKNAEFLLAQSAYNLCTLHTTSALGGKRLKYHANYFCIESVWGCLLLLQWRELERIFLSDKCKCQSSGVCLSENTYLNGVFESNPNFCLLEQVGTGAQRQERKKEHSYLLKTTVKRGTYFHSYLLLFRTTTSWKLRL